MVDPVQTLLVNLKQKGISNLCVLAAIAQTPRDQFVIDEYSGLAYQDSALPLLCGQTISQPYVVARMTDAILGANSMLNSVLEVGTGSGYQAAVLSHVAKDVYSIERIETLYERAKLLLSGYQNIHLCHGDGKLGWQKHAPYDAIIVTAASDEVPQDLFDQLSEDGRLVIPVGGKYNQELRLYTKEDGEFHTELLDPVIFVPLLSGKS